MHFIQQRFSLGGHGVPLHLRSGSMGAGMLNPKDFASIGAGGVGGPASAAAAAAAAAAGGMGSALLDTYLSMIAASAANGATDANGMAAAAAALNSFPVAGRAAAFAAAAHAQAAQAASGQHRRGVSPPSISNRHAGSGKTYHFIHSTNISEFVY